jgi:hypothetical protein
MGWVAGDSVVMGGVAEGSVVIAWVAGGAVAGTPEVVVVRGGRGWAWLAGVAAETPATVTPAIRVAVRAA